MIRIVVSGAPRTKKTSNRLVTAGGRQRVLPSKAWSEWCQKSEITIDGGQLHRTTIGLLYQRAGDDFMAAEYWNPIGDPLNCAATFYRDALRGDAVGFYQGLADLLDKRGVIANDSQIVSWDGSRLLLDRENPRVELTLTPVSGKAT